MKHRHLNHSRFTLAAIDNIIGGGKWRDWTELRRAALADPKILPRIERICAHRAEDPYAQRFHFWRHYAAAHRRTA